MGKSILRVCQSACTRIRFSGESVTTLEREVNLPAGKTTPLEINLSPAPPPKEIIKVVQAPPPAPAAAPPGPAGQAGVLDVPELLEQDFVRKEPRRDTLIACSGNMRTMMLQLNEPLPERLYDKAEVVYYAIGGEGNVRLAGREMPLKVNGLVTVPRGTAHSITRRGNRTLVLLAFISGEPCETAK